MSLHLAILNGLGATGLQKSCHYNERANLEHILDLTHQLGEEVLCAKLSGKPPLERQITTLVIVAVELKKIGVQWPASLKYALDIPQPANSVDLIRAEKLGKLRGYVEVITCESVCGWAINEGSASKAAELEVLVNKVPVAIVIADVFRGDLAEAGVGSGRHAFVYNFERPISLVKNKKVTVRRRADRVRLEEVTF